MNDLLVFRNEQFGEVRTVAVDGAPWFVAADVCRALELPDTHKAVERLDDDEKGRSSIPTPGGPQKMTVVNEPGLYSLVLGSRKPEAKAFKRWVTHDVIPAIRKTGMYVAKDHPMTDYQRMMAETRMQNIRVRKAQLLNQIADQYDGTYRQVLQAHATKELTGEYLLPLPQLPEKTYTAEEIGVQLGISANMVGRLTNQYNLKTPEYGASFNDKARYSNKEVQAFRYYATVIPVLRKLVCCHK